MENRKILGVIGGMGPQATQSFYQDVINNTVASKDQEHIDMVIINHASMPDRTSAILSGDTEPVFEKLLNDAHKLEKFGVDYIAMPCNTSHYFIDKLKLKTKATFIDMIEETAKVLKQRGVKKAGIMATDGTLNSNIYKLKMEKFGIDTIYPSEAMQKKVMEIIYEQIKAGKEPSKESFEAIVSELKQGGAQAIVLGCTELSYYAQINKLEDFYVDAQKVLVRKAIELCGGKLVNI